MVAAHVARSDIDQAIAPFDELRDRLSFEAVYEGVAEGVF